MFLKKLCMCLKKKDKLAEDQPKLETFETFKSFLDKVTDEFESDHFFLHKIDLDLFLEYMINIRPERKLNFNREIQNSQIDSVSIQSETVPKLNYNMELDENKFAIFAETKLVNNPIITDNVNLENEELLINYFSFLKNLFFNMIKNYISFKKKNKEPYEEISTLSKSNLFTIGITFCNSLNLSKIQGIYDMFRENNEIKLTKKLREFFFMLFILNTRIYYNCLVEFYKPKEIFNEEQEEKIISVYNVENVIKFTDDFLKKIFTPIEFLTYPQFLQKFSSNIWICSGMGIRNKLENFQIQISKN